MHGEGITYAYGFWSLAIINAAIFVFFIISFFTPAKKREWRTMNLTIAFFVALFTEMYGFPLTIYILTSILGKNYPALNPYSHVNGHLWVALFGGGARMMDSLHLASNAMIVAGFIIIWKAWGQIHRGSGNLVTEGIYGWVRHPQYSGLFLILTAMLIQWPTIITTLMFPVMIYTYYRLAQKEENEMVDAFGDEYRIYRDNVPMFIPGYKKSIKRGQK